MFSTIQDNMDAMLVCIVKYTFSLLCCENGGCEDDYWQHHEWNSCVGRAWANFSSTAIPQNITIMCHFTLARATLNLLTWADQCLSYPGEEKTGQVLNHQVNFYCSWSRDCSYGHQIWMLLHSLLHQSDVIRVCRYPGKVMEGWFY